MPPGVKSVDSVHTFHTFHTNSHILATNIRGTDGLPFTEIPTSPGLCDILPSDRKRSDCILGNIAGQRASATLEILCSHQNPAAPRSLYLKDES